LVRFIDQHAARRTAGRRWGVASICAQLVELGAAIAPSTYYAARAAGPTAARLRDEALSNEIVRVHAENYGVYGARKVWACAQNSFSMPSSKPSGHAPGRDEKTCPG
jgi:putative transposase